MSVLSPSIMNYSCTSFPKRPVDPNAIHKDPNDRPHISTTTWGLFYPVSKFMWHVQLATWSTQHFWHPGATHTCWAMPMEIVWPDFWLVAFAKNGGQKIPDHGFDTPWNTTSEPQAYMKHFNNQNNTGIQEESNGIVPMTWRQVTNNSKHGEHEHVQPCGCQMAYHVAHIEDQCFYI